MRASLHLIAVALVLGVSILAGLEYVFAPTLLSSGRFHPVAHKGSGSASLYQGRDGRRFLALDGLNTAARPDLVVYLIEAKEAFDNDTVVNSGTLPLGPLRDSGSRQTYSVPAGVDLSRFHAVTIWSQKYHVNFTTAPLHSAE